MSTWAETKAEHAAELEALNDQQRAELDQLDAEKVRARQRFEDEHRRLVASHAAELRRRVVVFLAWFATNASRLVAAYVADAARANVLALYEFLRAAGERCTVETDRTLRLRFLTFELCKLELAKDPSTLAAFAEVPNPGDAPERTPRQHRSTPSNFHGRVVEAEGALAKLLAQPFDVVRFGAALAELEAAVHFVGQQHRGEVTEHMRRTWQAMLTDDQDALDRIDEEVHAANIARTRKVFEAAAKKSRLDYLRNRLRAGHHVDSEELRELEGGAA